MSVLAIILPTRGKELADSTFSHPKIIQPGVTKFPDNNSEKV